MSFISYPETSSSDGKSATIATNCYNFDFLLQSATKMQNSLFLLQTATKLEIFLTVLPKAKFRIIL